MGSVLKMKEIVKNIIAEIANEDLEKPIIPVEIDDEEPIGIQLSLNSVKTMKIVVQLEDKLGITIPDEDLDLKNFINVNTICYYINNLIQKERGRG